MLIVAFVVMLLTPVYVWAGGGDDIEVTSSSGDSVLNNSVSDSSSAFGKEKRK
jgi:hypothetical protein